VRNVGKGSLDPIKQGACGVMVKDRAITPEMVAAEDYLLDFCANFVACVSDAVSSQTGQSESWPDMETDQGRL
jgi:hypothetical protein